MLYVVPIIYDPFNLVGNRIDIRDFPDVIYVSTHEKVAVLAALDKWLFSNAIHELN